MIDYEKEYYYQRLPGINSNNCIIFYTMFIYVWSRKIINYDFKYGI